MICNLCKQDKKLLKKSHIIPDFTYNGVFNEKHRVILTKYSDLNSIKYVPSYYEKNILCSNCDNVIIGRLETYGSRILYYGKNDRNEDILSEQNQTIDDLNILKLKNIDYSKFKLFLLSLLWRASISKHYFFKEIDLGNHEEIIRNAIINNDPLGEEDYQMCIMVYEINNILPGNFIITPRKFKDKDDFSFCFYINGAFYLFTLAKDPNSDVFRNGRIKKNNEMEIPILDIGYAKKFLKLVWGIELQ